MNLNSFVFPAPKKEKKINQNLLKSDDILFIPRSKQKRFSCLSPYNYLAKQNKFEQIPCKLIKFQKDNKFSDKVVIFFHGNGEDLTYPCSIMLGISQQLKLNILMVEYPGYGFYKGKPDSKQIESDAVDVYQYLVKKTEPKNILIFGRSIGSGPACYLAGNYSVGLTILMAPFTNLKDAAKNLVGTFLSSFLKQRFQNDKLIQNIHSPIFFIHGLKDQIIPYQHSQQLIKICPSKQLGFHFSKNMQHNRHELFEDVIMPIKDFFVKIEFKVQLIDQDIFDIFQEQMKSSITINQDLQLQSLIKA